MPKNNLKTEIQAFSLPFPLTYTQSKQTPRQSNQVKKRKRKRKTIIKQVDDNIDFRNDVHKEN